MKMAIHPSRDTARALPQAPREIASHVTAILATGIAVKALCGFYRGSLAPDVGGGKPVNRRNAVLVLFAMMLTVGIPLTLSGIRSSTSALRELPSAGKAKHGPGPRSGSASMAHRMSR